jgi:hypothetical protein
VRSHSGRESGELPERKAVSVRTHTGDYAYEVTKELCARTEAVVHWDYMVYKVMPTEVVLSHGENSPSQEHAERNARQIIALCLELDRMEVTRGFTAA